MSSSVLSPVVSLWISHNDSSQNFNFLLDTGAQFSLIDSDCLKFFDIDKFCNSKFVTSFEGSSLVDGYKAIFNVSLPNGYNVPIEFFAKHKVLFDLYNPNWNKVVDEIVKNPNVLSKSYPKVKNNSVSVHGILGLDALQNFDIFEIVTFSNAKCLAISDGIIPLGFPKFTGSSKSCTNLRNTKIPNLSFKESKRCMKYVLDPVTIFESPLSPVFPDYNVEHGLDCLTSLESIGINPSMSSYDEMWVRDFEKSIQFKDGYYHVELPWNKDVLKKVPSNYDLSKAIAYSVHKRNTSSNISQAYLDAFAEQENLGIIERIDVKNPSSHIWIPHRAVVREGEAYTTKIRPVFNCSLAESKRIAFLE